MASLSFAFTALWSRASAGDAVAFRSNRRSARPVEGQDRLCPAVTADVPEPYPREFSACGPAGPG